MTRWLLLARERWPRPTYEGGGLNRAEWQAHHSADIEAVDVSFEGYRGETFAAVVYAPTEAAALALLDDYAWLPWIRPEVRPFPPRHPDEPAQWRALVEADAALTAAVRAQPFPVGLHTAAEAERSLLARAESLGENHPFVAHLLSSLHHFAQDFGPYNEMVPLARRILAIHESFVGPDDPSLIVDWIRLAQSERGLISPEGVPSDSDSPPPHERAYCRAIELAETGLPRGHPSRVTALHQYALFLSGYQQYAAALPLWRRAVEAVEETARHPSDGPTSSLLDPPLLLAELGRTLAVLDQHEEAESVFRRVVHLREQERGDKHRYVQFALADLASACAETGKLIEAVDLYQRLLHLHAEWVVEATQNPSMPPEQAAQMRASLGAMRAHYLDRFAPLLQRLNRTEEADAATAEAARLRAAATPTQPPSPLSPSA